MKKITIAIDGYSGTGKSSTAKEVARKLGYAYIDSGAMYRALTYHVIRKGISKSDESSILAEASSIDLSFPSNDQEAIFLNGNRLGHEIRTSEVSDLVSAIATIPEVRREMVRQQQILGADGGIVMDGRDIGTVVFPKAELKVFMTASTDVRAQRRLLELKQRGIASDIQKVRANLLERDRIDSTRSEGPLKKANGALEVDTTNRTFEEQVEIIVKKAKEIIDEN